MSEQVRALAFGEPDGSLWAAAVPVGAGVAVFGVGPAAEAVADLRVSDDGPGWALSAAGVRLRAEAVDDADASAASVKLVQVRGTITVGGTTVDVDCAGTLAAVRPERSGIDSARAVSAWFGTDGALGLLALRTRPDRHGEDDAIAGRLFDPDGPLDVSEPRLSTSYGPGGEPARMGLELWSGEGEDETVRRAAGEVSGPGAVATGDGMRLHAAPLRCHMRGHDGAGVYALVRW